MRGPAGVTRAMLVMLLKVLDDGGGLYRLRGATRILRSLSADNWTSAAGQSADQSIPGVTSDSRRALIAGMRASFRRCEHWPIDAVLDELALPEDEPVNHLGSSMAADRSLDAWSTSSVRRSKPPRTYDGGSRNACGTTPPGLR